jgi:hypothetical protein
VNGQIALSAIQTNVTYNRITEVFFAWTSGGGHVALVIGYNTANTNVLVSDPSPLTGQFWTTYADLQTAYGMGSWVQSWTLSG